MDFDLGAGVLLADPFLDALVVVELNQFLVFLLVLILLGGSQNVDVVLGALVDLFMVDGIGQNVQVAGQGNGVPDQHGVNGLDDAWASRVVDQLELELLWIGGDVVHVAIGVVKVLFQLDQSRALQKQEAAGFIGGVVGQGDRCALRQVLNALVLGRVDPHWLKVGRA